MVQSPSLVAPRPTPTLGNGIALSPINAISLRGITTGKVAVRDAGFEGVRCGMICSSWPHWLPFLASLGLTLEWIYVIQKAGGSDWLEMGRRLGYITEDVVVVSSGERLECETHRSRAEVVFMSGTRTSRTLTFPLVSEHIKLIVTTGGIRRNKQEDWMVRSHVIMHAAVGGVTDHVQLVQAWRPAGQVTQAPRSLQGRIARDLSTIVNTTADGGRERPRPHISRVEPPRVLELAPGLYHGFGHFPLGARPAPEFLVPSVFTKTKWARRVLTVQERLLTLDLPETRCSRLTPAMMQDIARVAIPGKILLAAWEVTGGITRFAATSLSNRLLGQNDAAPAPEFSHRTIGLKREGGQVDETNHEHKKSKEGVVSTQMDTEEDTVDVTVDIGGHLKATKRDDAVVRTEMWRYFLLKGFPHVKEHPDLECHLDVLRQWLLQRWKHNTTASFLKWLHEAAHQSSKVSSLVEYNATQGWYQWTRGGIRQYRRWSREWKKGANSRDLEAGKECL